MNLYNFLLYKNKDAVSLQKISPVFVLSFKPLKSPPGLIWQPGASSIIFSQDVVSLRDTAPPLASSEVIGVIFTTARSPGVVMYGGQG